LWVGLCKLYRYYILLINHTFKNIEKDILLNNENEKKTKLASKSLWRMQSALFLEEKVGKGLGRGKILFSKVQKRS